MTTHKADLIALICRRLERDEARIVFDPNSETVDIVTVTQLGRER